MKLCVWKLLPAQHLLNINKEMCSLLEYKVKKDIVTYLMLKEVSMTFQYDQREICPLSSLGKIYSDLSI